MKVLYLTYSPSPYKADLFEELGKLVSLTVCYETTPKEDKTKRNSNWYKIKNKNFRSIYLKNNYFFKKRISFDIINLLKKNIYDIIVISGYNTPTSILTMSYLKLKKIPFIISTDGGFVKNKELKIVKILKKALIKMGSYYLVSGDNAEKYFIAYGARKEKIFKYPFTSIKESDMIQKPVNARNKEELRQELKIVENNIIVSVGQFIYRKGFDILITACINIHKNIGVYIIGGKPTEEYLKIIKENNMDNIHFIDFKPKEELIKYLKMADAFVLPTREDIYGLVVVEALSMGLPVITTNKCGAGLDLIRNGYNGYIFKNGDAEELKSIIKHVFNEKNKINEMSINALKSIKNYTIENEAKVHFEVFKKILKK